MADVVDKFSVRFWNGEYYCAVKLSDGSSQELKSATDLNYTQWQTRISAAWAEKQIPPVVEPTLAGATKEEIAAECQRRHYTAADLGLNGGAMGQPEIPK
jgi:hypothetical protein